MELEASTFQVTVTVQVNVTSGYNLKIVTSVYWAMNIPCPFSLYSGLACLSNFTLPPAGQADSFLGSAGSLAVVVHAP